MAFRHCSQAFHDSSAARLRADARDRGGGMQIPRGHSFKIDAAKPDVGAFITNRH